MVVDLNNTEEIFVIVIASSGCCVVCCALVCCFRDAARRTYWAQKGQDTLIVGQDPSNNGAVSTDPLAGGADAPRRSLLTGYVVPARRLDICARGRKAARAAASAGAAAAARAKPKMLRRDANNAERSYAKVTAAPEEDIGLTQADSLFRLYGELTSLSDDESVTSTPRRPSRQGSKNSTKDMVSDMQRAARHLESRSNASGEAPSRGDDSTRASASSRSASAKSTNKSRRSKDLVDPTLRGIARGGDVAGSSKGTVNEAKKQSVQDTKSSGVISATPYGKRAPPQPDGSPTPLLAEAVEMTPSAMKSPSTLLEERHSKPQRASNEAMDACSPAWSGVNSHFTAGHVQELQIATAAKIVSEADKADSCKEEPQEDDISSVALTSTARRDKNDSGLELMGGLTNGGDLLQQIELPSTERSTGSKWGRAIARDQKFDSLDAELSIELEDGRSLSLVMDAHALPRTSAGLPMPPKPTPGASALRPTAAARGRSSSASRQQDSQTENGGSPKQSRSPQRSSTKKAKPSSKEGR